MNAVSFKKKINVTFCDILELEKKTANEVRKINLTEDIFYENIMLPS